MGSSEISHGKTSRSLNGQPKLQTRSGLICDECSHHVDMHVLGNETLHGINMLLVIFSTDTSEPRFYAHLLSRILLLTVLLLCVYRHVYADSECCKKTARYTHFTGCFCLNTCFHLVPSQVCGCPMDAIVPRGFGGETPESKHCRLLNPKPKNLDP